MILVEKITIQEFRGIRNLTLNFKGQNFAICGPNGTGKSGVVDALEFALTGNISRLSGRGMGGVTLREHAPHVDSRDNPEKALVAVTLRIPSLEDREVVIERNVKNPTVLKVTPSSPEALDILEQLKGHPEFVLSRRELISYILAQPGERSEEIQALLRLDQVGELRATLKKISNACKRDETTLTEVRRRATGNLLQALQIPDLISEKLLKAVNSRRSILGLAAINTLTSTTSLRDGLETAGGAGAPTRINKTQALADLKRVQELLDKIQEATMVSECDGLTADLRELSVNPIVLDSVSKERFLRMAVDAISDNACPVCDTEWEIETLKSLVEAKLNKYEEITKLRNALEKQLISITAVLGEFSNLLSSLGQYSEIVAKEQVAVVSAYQSELASKISVLKKFFPLSDTVTALDGIITIPKQVIEAIEVIEKGVFSLPEPTQQEAARDYLILCQDRLEAYREAARSADKAKEHSELAAEAYDVYAATSTEVLEGVYKEVEEDFSNLYRLINSDDEGEFTARLIPSMGKLGFDVEFYGRGHFPPGAYHSEGHQDGMGLCLYLALMRRLEGDHFTFAVLDDILMSVDTAHRREVCNLLKQLFPNTQFVLTTHDEVWLKHMMSAGLIDQSSAVRFSNWNPDHGPTEWESRDVWSEITNDLGQGNVRAAAGLLRYYLEHIYKEVCHNLRAPVEFRGDGRYDLGDVLPPAVRRLRDLLLEGKKVAESWDKKTESDRCVQYEKKVSDSLQTSNAEQWQINSAVHYNEWANLTAEEFALVVDAFRELVSKFYCGESGCTGLLYIVATSPKTSDALRCPCGSININLKKKPKG